MQNKIVKPDDLLDNTGNLKHSGYATSLLLNYDRKKIKAGALRIKEWDYYLVYNNNFAIALTIADNSYMGLISASFIDFNTPHEITKSVMTILPKGKTNLPSTSKIGNSVFKNKNVSFEFLNDGKTRKLKLDYKNFNKKDTLSVDITLDNEPKDSMVIATPFHKPKHFYYNQKIVGMKASGTATLGDKKVTFSPENSLGILDWGRGVWTYKNTWYWGAGCGYVNKKLVGFNIGYGFGDTSQATENMVFVDGTAHKLEDVSFNIPMKNGKEDFLSPWTFTSSDNRFEMTFTPIIDRNSYTSALVISSNQHQVFGKFNGTIILDDGKKIEIKDFLAFAEKVVNKW